MFGSDAQQATQRLGKLSLAGSDEQPIESGEQVHALLFESGTLKVPHGWIGIANYF